MHRGVVSLEAWARLALYLFAAYGVLTLALSLLDRLARLSSRSYSRSPLSIVLLARNNESIIEQVVRSVTGLCWFSTTLTHDVVVVDDRSSDGTGLVLERLTRRYGRLKVVRLGESPVGRPALEVGMFLTANPVAVVCDLRSPRDVQPALSALFLLLRNRGAASKVRCQTTAAEDN
jgi:cellulose synthase/poly-beta-1,6-N-acetylglucosamine synthase-like glycosyltransferase